MESSMSQLMRNLKIGGQYAISWTQTYRPGTGGYISIYILVDNVVVYSNPSLKLAAWTRMQSQYFIANSTQHTVTIFTKNPSIIYAAAFIDDVELVDIGVEKADSLSYAYNYENGTGMIDGDFESYASQFSNNSGFGGNAFLSPGMFVLVIFFEIIM